MSTLISTGRSRRASASSNPASTAHPIASAQKLAASPSLADIRVRLVRANARMLDPRQVERIVHTVRCGK